MAAQQLSLVCDNSTLANFISWAQAISAWFSTAGWVQSSDTGQVNWSTISAVPSQNRYVYEIWEPNDGLTNFFLRMEFGCGPQESNQPAVRLSIGTSTDGAGNLLGLTMGPYNPCQNGDFWSPSTTMTYDCRFSGAPGRIAVMMWRNNSTVAQVFGVERSINASGAYTSSHVTLMMGGNVSAGRNAWTQQTLVFGIGVAPAVSIGGYNAGGMPARLFFSGQNTTAMFNGSVPFDTTAPCIGYFDYPLTSFGLGPINSLTEGVLFTSTAYGANHTFLPSSSGYLGRCGEGVSDDTGVSFLCMRYD